MIWESNVEVTYDDHVFMIDLVVNGHKFNWTIMHNDGDVWRDSVSLVADASIFFAAPCKIFGPKNLIIFLRENADVGLPGAFVIWHEVLTAMHIARIAYLQEELSRFHEECGPDSDKEAIEVCFNHAKMALRDGSEEFAKAAILAMRAHALKDGRENAHEFISSIERLNPLQTEDDSLYDLYNEIIVRGEGDLPPVTTLPEFLRARDLAFEVSREEVGFGQFCL